MKKFIFIVIAGLVLADSQSFAQTLGDLYNQNQGNRENSWKQQDDRKVTVSMFGDYFVSPSATINTQTAFVGGVGGGLKVSIPSFTKGDGTIGGDNTGDWTISAAYIDWIGSLDANSNSFPDWNAFRGMLGYRIGLGDIMSIEPQVGYSYGTCANTYYAFSSSDVSGITYAFHVGITFVHGFELYGMVQSTTSKAFGSPIDYGAGLELHF